jgi:predicted site-specific integrase-resolvase
MLQAKQSDWPKVGTMAEWSRILDVSVITLGKYVRIKRLKATKNLNNSWMITREAIRECFKV